MGRARTALRGTMLAVVLTGAASGGVRAWEVETDGGLCLLRHSEGAVSVLLTHDPALPLYRIELTGPDPWPEAGRFAMRFEGARPNLITTDRHALSADGRTLSVSDRGFGNVLDGLEFNARATGFSGDAALSVSLDGAAEAVAAFRRCGAAPSA